MTLNPQSLWDIALNQLEVQLDRASFETWLRGAVCLGQETVDAEPLFTIGVRNTFAVDMLQHRLYRTLRRIMSDVYGAPVSLQFVVHHPENKTADETPLFRLLAQHQAEAAPPPLHQQVIRPERPDLPESELNNRLTFDRFIAGNNNNLVYSAAQAVADNPASIYNPFVVYGGVGLGKTHLLHAIAHVCHSKNLRVIYIPSEAFINDLVAAIRQRTTAMFRDKYRSVDVLLVDDIQFIAGKESTQEEFFHTFNALYTFNKQIVLASDRHPRELELLEDRLRSRFEGGLVMDVQLPEFETRVAILESWAQERRVQMPRSVMEMIANHSRSNIRELEGLFTQMLAKTQLGHAPLTLSAAEALVSEFEQPRQYSRQTVSMDAILHATAAHFALKLKDLTGKSRTGRVNHARQIAMYLVRDLTEASLPQIGEAFGGRSHTTILHGYNKVAEMLVEDEVFRYELMALREKIIKSDAP